MMLVASSVRNGTPGKSSLGGEREGYNRLMDCANSGQMRDVRGLLVGATFVLTSPAHAGYVLGAKHTSGQAAVR
jgi:hypothetical protein